MAGVQGRQTHNIVK